LKDNRIDAACHNRRIRGFLQEAVGACLSTRVENSAQADSRAEAMVSATTSSRTLSEGLVTVLCQIVISDVSVALNEVLEELAINQLTVYGVVVVRADNGR
jgi:uncharacterized membrane protein YheB (UPF0754 family)